MTPAAVSSAMVAASSAASTGSLTGVTVIVAVYTADVSLPPSAVPPSSTAVTEMVATPLASAAGVKVKVPALPTAGSAANRAGWSTVTVNPTRCADSFAGPGAIAVAHASIDDGPLSSSTVTGAPPVNRGGSLRGVTVTVTVVLSQRSVASHSW